MLSYVLRPHKMAFFSLMSILRVLGARQTYLLRVMWHPASPAHVQKRECLPFERYDPAPSWAELVHDASMIVSCPSFSTWPLCRCFEALQGAPLAHNLRRTLSGGPLRRWAPQATFLSLITAGDRHAVATKGGWLGAQVLLLPCKAPCAFIARNAHCSSLARS